MEVRVLGCSGGIGAGRKTSSYLLDKHTLLDAGSGVSDLSLEEMTQIRRIFVTHSHLDHVHSIPMLLDSVFDKIKEPISVHAQQVTLEALQEHIFNWVVWPDFSALPHPERPVVQFVPMEPGDKVLADGLELEMVPVNHTVPGVAYIVNDESGACMAYSGDTTTNTSFWQALNRRERLDLLFVEAAFSDEQEGICMASKHYSPKLLTRDLQQLQHELTIQLTHGKPGEEQNILHQCQQRAPDREFRLLSEGDVFHI